jgi:ribosome-binding protein aMBF1 (putative translation factor)
MSEVPRGQPRSGRQQRLADLPAAERTLLGELGKRLRRARSEKGQTIAQTAAEVGVDPSYLGEVERGRANISVTTLAALSRSLGVTLHALLPED